MWPLWFLNLSGNHNENTQKKTHWRKTVQMLQLWICLHFIKQSIQAQEETQWKCYNLTIFFFQHIWLKCVLLFQYLIFRFVWNFGRKEIRISYGFLSIGIFLDFTVTFFVFCPETFFELDVVVGSGYHRGSLGLNAWRVRRTNSRGPTWHDMTWYS